MCSVRRKTQKTAPQFFLECVQPSVSAVQQTESLHGPGRATEPKHLLPAGRTLSALDRGWVEQKVLRSRAEPLPAGKIYRGV